MTTLGAFMGFLLLSGGPMVLQVPAIANETPTYEVTLTAYNAVPEQTDSTPLVTASGAYSNPEVVAARSRDFAEDLPFGTIIEIDGTNALEGGCGYSVVEPIIGYRVIADTMNARFTKRIDILFSEHFNFTMKGGAVKNAGIVLGVCDGVSVRVVGYVDIKSMPKTQMELVALVHGSTGLARR